MNDKILINPENYNVTRFDTFESLRFFVLSKLKSNGFFPTNLFIDTQSGLYPVHEYSLYKNHISLSIEAPLSPSKFLSIICHHQSHKPDVADIDSHDRRAFLISLVAIEPK